MKKILYTLFLSIVLISCKKETKYEVITTANTYSIEIPTYLRKTNNLNEDASLQYMNMIKELYVMVINEPISEFEESLIVNNLQDSYSKDLKGYSSILIHTFENETSSNEIINQKDTIINNLPAIVYKKTATVDGVEVYYHFAYLQGKENFYQVFTWTLAEEEKTHNKVMEKMLYSFKEL